MAIEKTSEELSKLLEESQRSLSRTTETVLKQMNPLEKSYFLLSSSLKERSQILDETLTGRVSDFTKQFQSNLEDVIKESEGANLASLKTQRARIKNLKDVLIQQESVSDKEREFLLDTIKELEKQVSTDITKQSGLGIGSFLSKNKFDIGSVLAAVATDNPILAVAGKAIGDFIQTRVERSDNERKDRLTETMALREVLEQQTNELKESLTRLSVKSDEQFGVMEAVRTYTQDSAVLMEDVVDLHKEQIRKIDENEIRRIQVEKKGRLIQEDQSIVINQESEKTNTLLEKLLSITMIKTIADTVKGGLPALLPFMKGAGRVAGRALPIVGAGLAAGNVLGRMSGDEDMTLGESMSQMGALDRAAIGALGGLVVAGPKGAVAGGLLGAGSTLIPERTEEEKLSDLERMYGKQRPQQFGVQPDGSMGKDGPAQPTPFGMTRTIPTPAKDTPIPKKQVASRSSIREFNELFDRVGFTTDPLVRANVLAQIKDESQFVPQEEDLRYSAERLMQVFKGYFDDIEDARRVAEAGPEAIGNRIYGGRMGNLPDEGFKFRGRGFIQLTGRENYERMGEELGIDLVNNPDLALDPEIAKAIAVVYLARRMGRNPERFRDIDTVTRAVGPRRETGAFERRREIAQNIHRDLMIQKPPAQEKNTAHISQPIVVNQQQGGQQAQQGTMPSYVESASNTDPLLYDVLKSQYKDIVG